MKRFPAIAAVLALPLMLGGCGVADLVAHGVKTVEKNNAQSRTATSQPTATAQPASYDRPAEEPPPPLVNSSVPARESIKVEELK